MDDLIDRKEKRMNDKAVYDPYELVKDLADKIGIHQLNTRPTTKIEISGFEVLALDINSGWEISKVIFDDEVPAPDIDELVITIKKRRNDE